MQHQSIKATTHGTEQATDLETRAIEAKNHDNQEKPMTNQHNAAAMTEEQLEWVAGGKAGGYEPGARYVDWKAYASKMHESVE